MQGGKLCGALFLAVILSEIVVREADDNVSKDLQF
jgi:hypothetical protein